MAFATLYGMWQDAHERKVLPAEWKRAGDFLHWATANGYKAEFGYKGEFGPESCASSIPTSKPDLASEYTLAELKAMAAERGIELGDAKTKKDIAALLAEG